MTLGLINYIEKLWLEGPWIKTNHYNDITEIVKFFCSTTRRIHSFYII